ILAAGNLGFDGRDFCLGFLLYFFGVRLIGLLNGLFVDLVLAMVDKPTECAEECDRCRRNKQTPIQSSSPIHSLLNLSSFLCSFLLPEGERGVKADSPLVRRSGNSKY